MLDFGRRYQDPRIWWEAVETALACRARQDRPLPHQRQSPIDGTSGTILPVDRNDGTPLGLASMYDDFAEASDLARVTAAAPIETPRRAAAPRPWRAPCRCRQRRRLAHIIHQADWIAGQFSGRFDVTDENNALKTGYDPIARQWPAWIAQDRA